MTLTKILRLQLSFQLESLHIEVAALIDKPIEYFLPPTLEERRKIFYENYAASVTDEEWKEIEREEKKRIISMAKGKRSHLLIRANTKSSEDHATKFLSYYTKKEVSMTTNQNQISHQAKITVTLDRLIARFGDTLNNFTKIDKLDLIAILAFWQGADSRNLECDLELITLGDFLNLRPSFQADTSQDVNQALKILADCSESDAMAVITAIVHQSNDYQKG